MRGEMNTIQNPDDLNSEGRLRNFCSVKSTRDFSLPISKSEIKGVLLPYYNLTHTNSTTGHRRGHVAYLQLPHKCHNIQAVWRI